MPGPQERPWWGAGGGGGAGTVLSCNTPVFLGPTWAGTILPPPSCWGITSRKAVPFVLGLVSGPGSGVSGWSRGNISCGVG